MSKTKVGETLYIYLVVSKRAVIVILVHEKIKALWSMYYVSEALLDVETQYLKIKKLSLALVVGAK